MFFGLPDPDPLVGGMDPEPGSSLSYRKKYENNFFYILKVTEERSRIRSRIRIHYSGYAPKCHGSPNNACPTDIIMMWIGSSGSVMILDY
jgi:hypothetical protein